MSPQKRPRTVSLSLSESGQTTQDFVVGIGIFLLAVAFVFSFVPSIITPYTAATTAETAQADRIADTIVAEHSDENRANEIILSDLEGTELETLGLRAVSSDDSGDMTRVDRIQILIEQSDEGEEPWEHDDSDAYDGESAGTATRVVTVENEESGENIECNPSCRLVVRVW